MVIEVGRINFFRDKYIWVILDVFRRLYIYVYRYNYNNKKIGFKFD